MPPLEESELQWRTITLFPKVTIDEFGHLDPGEGVEIQARWVNTTRQVIEPDSSVINIMADVAVERELKVGDLLWNGRLADYEDGTGTGDIELCEVRLRRTVPDIKGETSRFQ